MYSQACFSPSEPGERLSRFLQIYLLKKCPEGIVKGIDYSPVSVEKSKKVNEAAIAEGRCAVLQLSLIHI